MRRDPEQLQRDEEELHELLRHVDHVPPAVLARGVIAHARAGSRVRVRWAAGVTIAFAAAGAAYAAPGSPLPRWIDRVVSSFRQPERRMAPQAGIDRPAVSGISVAPGTALVIRFASPHGGSQARVSLSDGTDVVVTAPVDAASFTTGTNLLLIENQPVVATFEIAIPRNANRVDIRVGTRRVFLKNGATLTTSAPPDAQHTYTIPLAAPPR